MDPINLPMVSSLYVIDHKPKADTTEEKKIKDRRDALRHREACGPPQITKIENTVGHVRDISQFFHMMI